MIKKGLKLGSHGAGGPEPSVYERLESATIEGLKEVLKYGGGRESREGGQRVTPGGERGAERVTPSAELEALRAMEEESAAREAKKMAGEDKRQPYHAAGQQHGAIGVLGVSVGEHVPHGTAAAHATRRTGPVLHRHEPEGEEGGSAVAPVIEGVRKMSLEGGRRASEGVAAGVQVTGDHLEQMGGEARKAAVKGADTAVVSCDRL